MAGTTPLGVTKAAPAGSIHNVLWTSFLADTVRSYSFGCQKWLVLVLCIESTDP
jgi:hypothetical protein